ncbi:Uncharacterised protein [Mycobacteroides abscessus subsp. abscessus]|nr:Uncharacterised protein [Mycobacteroides abscessus subsp. abscessus]
MGNHSVRASHRVSVRGSNEVVADVRVDASRVRTTARLLPGRWLRLCARRASASNSVRRVFGVRIVSFESVGGINRKNDRI